MARAWHKLSANFVRRVSKRGRYADGGNLQLQIAKGGSKAWVFAYQRNGVTRAMGLGSARAVPLALARELAARAREQLARGIDPLDARKAAGLAQRAARARLMTFKACAEEYHAANVTRWTNAKHRDEWLSALRRFAFPVIGHLSVDMIDSAHVQKVLAPLVTTEKMVTAARLRGRIETVLDYAKAAGRRSGENPADKAIIAHMLPLRSEKSAVTHQPALPFTRLPALMSVLRTIPGKPARMLELLILTGMRSEAVRAARFDEFDLAAAVWIIPQGRMKALGRDQRIPLGPRAVELVRELRIHNESDLLFAGETNAKPIGRNEVGKLLQRLLNAIGHDGHAVAHGFRSAMKDWVHETGDYPAEVVARAASPSGRSPNHEPGGLRQRTNGRVALCSDTNRETCSCPAGRPICVSTQRCVSVCALTQTRTRGRRHGSSMWDGVRCSSSSTPSTRRRRSPGGCGRWRRSASRTSSAACARCWCAAPAISVPPSCRRCRPPLIDRRPSRTWCASPSSTTATTSPRWPSAAAWTTSSACTPTRTYTVAFCGFAPGFAYLTGLPTALQLPRRATPRPRVPAGSVAIAGELAAVYPTASPGGWHLIGRTDLTLFDVDRDPPALFSPGTVVRFDPELNGDDRGRCARDRHDRAGPRPHRLGPPRCRAVRCGRRRGPRPGQPAGRQRSRRAATLETCGALRLRFDAAAVLAVTGAPADLAVEGGPPMGVAHAHALPVGATLSGRRAGAEGCAATWPCAAASTSRRCSARAAATRSARSVPSSRPAIACRSARTRARRSPPTWRRRGSRGADGVPRTTARLVRLLVVVAQPAVRGRRRHRSRRSPPHRRRRAATPRQRRAAVGGTGRRRGPGPA